jgi:hypothetical protein
MALDFGEINVRRPSAKTFNYTLRLEVSFRKVGGLLARTHRWPPTHPDKSYILAKLTANYLYVIVQSQALFGSGSI